MTNSYDLVVIGAGSGGLVAARFASQLGAKVALVEKNRIGGDCTWTGCVPSKALLKAARVAHQVRRASDYGISSSPPTVDMAQVRAYVRGAIQAVYQEETPEQLKSEGIEVAFGEASFMDASTISVGGRLIHAKRFLITTGARPLIPAIAGLNDVPFLTYENLFDVEVLPKRLIIVGGGPVGIEMAQAYQRLGAQVTVIAKRLLPKEDQDVQTTMLKVFGSEGIRFLFGEAKSARQVEGSIVISTEHEEAEGDLLLIAAGRRPNVERLELEKAGVHYSARGIPVDEHLRTSCSHIFAAGDVAGGYQFTHFAGWQSFQAVRNALLPGSSSGTSDLVPQVTYTDPEVAHIGLSEDAAKAQFGEAAHVHLWNLEQG